ncbi:MAG: nucleoside kinase [Eubacterium sp.]|nr:nucleoside kinase [Eubacterium sp.]
MIKLKLKVADKVKDVGVLSHTTLKSVVDNFVPEYRKTAVGAFVNRRLQELGEPVDNNAEVEFLFINSMIGYDMYKRSLILLMLKAIRDVLDKEESRYRVKIMYSLGKGFFCKIEDDETEITDQLLAKIKARMQEMIDFNLPFEKTVYSTSEMSSEFASRDLKDKVELLKYRRASKMNIYMLDGYKEYFYGYMLPSTGFIKGFDLVSYDDGFVLVLPNKKTLEVDFEYEAPKKLYSVLRKTEDWGEMLHVGGVGELNNKITQGYSNDLILVQEALMEKQIADIAETIVKENKKLVLIAGPSSSGKTTFSNRLSIQLKAHGINPHPIAMDNFFKERSETPRDAEGKLDFESINAMDLNLLDDKMARLLAGEEVEMPTFDFLVGRKVYDGTKLKLGQDDVLVMEGIHALNPESTKALPKDSCYKVYISALTQLNLDEHNRISTTDTRLLRRIVRDARTRGHSAEKTILMWPSVRKGEEENIFPFQEEADVMFNSAIIYELPAIKQFVEPLLFGVSKESDAYYEAKRLLKFLDYFLGIDVQMVPLNSLMREFIGGGCFKV